jgi:L-ascorbate metabolism protein UlaG (beta-lactamase superfamily)
MADLVKRGHRHDGPAPDPAKIFYRRAAGLEARFHPDVSWNEIEIGRSDKAERARLSLDKAKLALGLVEWKTAAELDVSPAALWKLVELDLLFFAHARPERNLSGRSGTIATGKRIARRLGCWPTGAVETAIEIAPMPFMPRVRDLSGAKWVGVRFASLEGGHEVFGLTITGSEKIGRATRGLLPHLNGRMGAKEIVESLPKEERHDAERILDVLDLATILEARDAPPGPSFATDRPQVTWLGHGAVLVQSGKHNVLVDPIFYAASDPPERYQDGPRFDPRSLPKLDAVLITHGDNDHCNPNALSLIPRETKIIVPSLDTPPLDYQVDIAGMLRLLGFETIIELDAWEGHGVGDLLITALPFEGESWDLDLPKATYLVESDRFAVYCSADAARMDAAYEQLRSRGRSIDLAFMGVSGNAEALTMPSELGYGNFYADWIPLQRRNEWAQHCAGPVDAAHSCAIFEPRHAFGYAAGGASYIRTSYSDRGDHAELAAALRASPHATKPVTLPLGSPVAIEALGDYISP